MSGQSKKSRFSWLPDWLRTRLRIRKLRRNIRELENHFEPLAADAKGDHEQAILTEWSFEARWPESELRRTPGQHLGGGRTARRDKFGGEADAATVRGQPRGDAGVPTWLRRTGSRPTSYRSHTWSRYRTSRLSSRSGGSSSNSIVTGLAESVAGVNVWCNRRQASAASS